MSSKALQDRPRPDASVCNSTIPMGPAGFKDLGRDELLFRLRQCARLRAPNAHLICAHKAQ